MDASTVIALAALVLSIPTTLGLWGWLRFGRLDARKVSAYWGDETQPGLWVDNRADAPTHRVYVTVTHLRSEVRVREGLGDVAPTGRRLLPADRIASAIRSRRRDASPDTDADIDPVGRHDWMLTYRGPSGGLWLRLGSTLRALRVPLVIWCEATRATGLRDHLNRGFTHRTGARVTFRSFTTVEDLHRKLARRRSAWRRRFAFNIPDVIVGPHDWLGDLIEHRDILPVTLTAEQEDRFSATALAALSVRDDRLGRTVLYGVPYAMDTVALLINTDLAPGIPTTFDELMETGNALVAAGKARVPLALQVGPNGDPYHLWPIFSSAGGRIFDALIDHNHSWPDDWHADLVAAFETIRGLGDRGCRVLSCDVDRARAIRMFLNLETPYLICSSRALSQLQDHLVDHPDSLRVAVVAVPRLRSDERGQRSTLVSTYGFFLYRHGRSLNFAEDLATHYMAQRDTGIELCDIQPRPPVQLLARDHVAQRFPLLKTYIEECDQGVPMPSIPQMRRVWTALGEAETAVLRGADAVTTVDRLIESVGELLRLPPVADSAGSLRGG